MKTGNNNSLEDIFSLWQVSTYHQLSEITNSSWPFPQHLHNSYYFSWLSYGTRDIKFLYTLLCFHQSTHLHRNHGGSLEQFQIPELCYWKLFANWLLFTKLPSLESCPLWWALTLRGNYWHLSYTHVLLCMLISCFEEESNQTSLRV